MGVFFEIYSEMRRLIRNVPAEFMEMMNLPYSSVDWK